MIRSWKNDASRFIWAQPTFGALKNLDSAVVIDALLALNVARHTDDLAPLKCLGLRRKKGHGSKRWTMTVGDRWRVRFDDRKGEAYDVKVTGGKPATRKPVEIKTPRAGKARSHLTVPAVHPGRFLKREMMVRALSASRLALDLGVPSGRITDILNARRAITADTAVRLGRYLGTSAQFWCDLQSQFDIAMVERKKGADIRRRIRQADAIL